MAEILFKVGDSGGSKDGDIISIKPDGWLIPASDMVEWIDNDIEPTILSEMPNYLQRRWRQRICELKWKLNHTAKEIAKEFNLGDEESGNMEKEIAIKNANNFKTEGADTSWGRMDLVTHAAIRVDGLSLHDINELTDRFRDEDHVGYIRNKRRYGLQYRNILPIKKINMILDKKRRVNVDRRNPISKTQLLAAIREKTR